MSGFNGFFDDAPAGGGVDFLPIVKYDARSGRMSKRDRDNGETHETDITRSCLLYTSPSPRDGLLSRMPSSA